ILGAVPHAVTDAPACWPPRLATQARPAPPALVPSAGALGRPLLRLLDRVRDLAPRLRLLRPAHLRAQRSDRKAGAAARLRFRFRHPSRRIRLDRAPAPHLRLLPALA